VRSTILILLAILVFAATPARAQRAWLGAKAIGVYCDRESTPADNTDRLAKRLNLTDPQKAALRDLNDARASAAATMKTSLCADKPDLSTSPGRVAFGEKLAESTLARLKAIEPKLQVFYGTLDENQKKKFDTGSGRVREMFDWLKEKVEDFDW
jgi:hypothetical protein